MTRRVEEVGQVFNPHHTEIDEATMRQVIGFLGPDYGQLMLNLFAVKLGVRDLKIDVHGHLGSDVIYAIEENMGLHRYYGSIMRPNSKTSAEHSHEWPNDLLIPEELTEAEATDVTEEYHSFEGEAFVRLTKGIHTKELVLNKDNPVIYVPPGTKHKVKTRENWAAFGIRMRNGALIPEARLHITS